MKVNYAEAKVLRQLLDTSNPWEAAGRVRLAFPRYVRTLKNLKRKHLVAMKPGHVTLTSRGRQVAHKVKLRSSDTIDQALARGVEEFKRISESRPSSISTYDQGFMTVESVFNRLELMVKMGDVDGRRIAILGDDDLLSIAICLASEPESVTVFEIDKRLVEFILDIARKYGFPIDSKCFDLREPLPKSLMGKYDTFASDPSETFAGLKMFIGRGLFMLRAGEGRAAYFGLTSIEASNTKWAKLQRWLLNRYELAITHILPENAYYQNWPDLIPQTARFGLEPLRKQPISLWFNSSLIRMETLKGFKPKPLGRIRSPIFNDDEACGVIGQEGT